MPPMPRSTSPTRAEIKVYQTQDEANQDLAAGRIDATQADSIALDAFLASEAGKACCELKGLWPTIPKCSALASAPACARKTPS